MSDANEDLKQVILANIFQSIRDGNDGERYAPNKDGKKKLRRHIRHYVREQERQYKVSIQYQVFISFEDTVGVRLDLTILPSGE